MHNDHAFIYAANSGMVSLLEVFVEKGQDINVTDDEGSTALHSAVVNNQPDSVRELLRLGIDTTIKTNLPADPDDEPAMTALELAEGGGFEGSEEMVSDPKARMVAILRHTRRTARSLTSRTSPSAGSASVGTRSPRPSR